MVSEIHPSHENQVKFAKRLSSLRLSTLVWILDICEECAFWLVYVEHWKHNGYRILYNTVTFVRIQFSKWCPHHSWYEDYRTHNYAAADSGYACGLWIGHGHDSTLHLTDISDQTFRMLLEEEMQSLHNSEWRFWPQICIFLVHILILVPIQ